MVKIEYYLNMDNGKQDMKIEISHFSKDYIDEFISMIKEVLPNNMSLIETKMPEWALKNECLNCEMKGLRKTGQCDEWDCD